MYSLFIHPNPSIASLHQPGKKDLTTYFPDPMDTVNPPRPTWDPSEQSRSVILHGGLGECHAASAKKSQHGAERDSTANAFQTSHATCRDTVTQPQTVQLPPLRYGIPLDVLWAENSLFTAFLGSGCGRSS